MPLKITICGGGIGGLAAAIYLREQHDVTVLERGELDYSSMDFGFSLFTNGVHLLQGLGVKREDLDGAPVEHIWYRDGRTVEEYSHLPFGVIMTGKPPSWSIRRGALRNHLYRLAISEDRPGKPAKVHFDTKVESVDTVTGTVRTAGGDVFESDLVIGADGIVSVVRAAVNDEKDSPSMPRTNDLVGFITHVPNKIVNDVPSLAFAQDPAQSGIAFFSAEGEPDNTKWTAKERFLMYQVSPREWQIIGYAPEGSMAEQFNNSTSSIIKDVPVERFSENFKDFSPDITGLYKHSPINAWRIRDIEEVDKWHKGRAVLMGDAAHALMPMAGQGCNMALEDAEALAYFLKDAHRAEDATAVLQQFSDIRKARVDIMRRIAKQIAGFTPEEERGEPISVKQRLSVFQYQGIRHAVEAEAEAEANTGKA